jgi:organic radical activating enzyme
MNLIITSKCNKGCSYCFASEFREGTQQNMSFDFFKEILDKTPKDKEIKLLGGEPTLHPEFELFLEELKKRNRKVVLISNFLFGDKQLSAILNFMDNHKLSFLANSTDLDQSTERIEKFTKNYKTIYKKLYQRDEENLMACGYTFEREKNYKYYLEYTDFLLKHILKIERLRLSLEFPWKEEEKNKFDFINDKSIGEKFLVMVKKALNIGAKPSIDCIVLPCFFLNKEEYKYVTKFSDKFKTICSTGAWDVFPDGTLSYCYPTKDALTIDIHKHRNFVAAGEEISIRYKVVESIVDLPEACKECPMRKSMNCAGPCLGFFDLSQIDIGKNLK